MSSNGRTAVSAELGVGLVGPEHTIVPLMASLSYSCHDPYAVTIAFHVGTDEPVEWTLARDLLAAALHSREGIGDVQVWSSAAAGDGLAGTGQKVLNIAMTSPFGHAEFEASGRGRGLPGPDLPGGAGRHRVRLPGFRRRADRAAQPGVTTPGLPAGPPGSGRRLFTSQIKTMRTNGVITT